MHSRVFLRAPILFLSSPPSSASMLRGRDFLRGPGSLGRKSAVAGAVASSFIGMGRDKGLVAIFFFFIISLLLPTAAMHPQRIIFGNAFLSPCWSKRAVI